MKRLSDEEIKEVMLGCLTTKGDRELIVNERGDAYGQVGSIVYSLNGSPPKGYAIAIPGIRQIHIYDRKGTRVRRLRDTVPTRGEPDGGDH